MAGTETSGNGVIGLTPLPSISDREFSLFQQLVYKETGIFLGPAKKALLVSRLTKRLRALGLGSFGDYFEFVVENGGEEYVVMLDSICTNETSFFRDRRQFDYLENQLVPHWITQSKTVSARRVRIWSAACSTGEEPYSIAMSLLGTLPDGWQIDILATDLSTKALSRAREGVWQLSRAEQIPEHYLKRFMLRGVRSQAGFIAATDELRNVIRFDRMNLNDEAYSVGRFDAVFCRNVLIYFDMQSKAKVISRLAACLEPNGVLFLGHSESLMGVTGMHSVGPNAYTYRA